MSAATVRAGTRASRRSSAASSLTGRVYQATTGQKASGVLLVRVLVVGVVLDVVVLSVLLDLVVIHVGIRVLRDRRE